MRTRILSRTITLLAVVLLTVAAQGQTWTALTNPPSSAVSACVLLTDAGVMCQSGSGWYKLTPDSNGSYVNGAWSTLASMPSGFSPASYASAVLADGRVVLVGAGSDSGTGAPNTVGAIYDPQADSWQMLPALTTQAAGSASCPSGPVAVVLGNGKLLVGTQSLQDLAVLDPATLTWTAFSPMGKAASSKARGKGWTALPDGSFFALDMSDVTESERLILSGLAGGTWSPAGSSTQKLHRLPGATNRAIQAGGCAVNGSRGVMGPALLRPDGTVFAVGADGLTGIFTPPDAGSTAQGSWSMGPSTPLPLNVEDGPAALLPSGHVLFGGTPGDTGVGLQYFEFDGTSLTSVPAPLASSQDQASATELLVLPSGEVLFVDGSSQVQVYDPATAPTYNAAWVPTISNVPATLNNGSTYQITGTQFNGLSQGSVDGRELRNATNYPLVRITNNNTGHVFYARTHDHSTMGVATGSTPVSTSFDVPKNIEAGASTVEVIANGIPSAPMAVTILTSFSALTVTTTALNTVIVNVAYSMTLHASGGVSPYTWAITAGRLPFGLSLNSTTGILSGTATSTVSDSLLTFTVTDSGNNPQQSNFAKLLINVVNPLILDTNTLPPGTTKNSYPLTLQAEGGISPYTWQITSGTLPDGLSLNSTTGQISGTPTTVSSTPLTVQVTDSSVPAQTASFNTTLIITNGQLSCLTTSLPTGVVNTSYSSPKLNVVGGTPGYTFQVTGGSLPNGLSLNSTSGAITGTPTVAVTNSPLTFTIADSATPIAQSITVNLNISIGTLLVNTTVPLPQGQANFPYTASLSATGGITPYNWTISSGTLPNGLSLTASTGQISGSPTALVTNAAITFMVTDAGSPTPQTATAALTLTVIAGPLTIVTTSLPDAQVGTAYSSGLTASGGITPYSWTITSGTLPSGLSLNSVTGQITGTAGPPGGTAQLTFKLTDSSTPTVQTQTVNLSLNAFIGALQITTTTLPGGQVNQAYSASLAATGGIPPYSWSSRRFPAGLTLNPSTGQITGTPTNSGTSQLPFTVLDSSNPALTTSTSLTLVVADQSTVLSILTTSLPGGQVNSPYSTPLMATGGIPPYSWQITGGTLPSGLSLNSLTGQITGTPTAAVTGTPLTFKVTDSTAPTAQTATTAGLTLTIVPVGSVSIQTTSLPSGQVGVQYSTFLSAINGTGPYSWQITGGSLPAGLTLNSATGQITGTPTAAVTSTPLTFKVTDSTTPTAQTATAGLSLTISNVPLPLTITTTSLPVGQINIGYSATLAASGGLPPYTWSTRRMPSGLTLNTQTGQIGGTPTVAGDQTVQFTVTDSTPGTAQTAIGGFDLNITAGGVIVTTSSLPSGQVGSPYSTSLGAGGGTSPYTWQVTSGSLPSGLSLNSTTGQISGTPNTAVNNLPLTFKVTDSSTPSLTATANLNLTITIATALTNTTTPLPAGQVGVSYTASLTATGGTTPYTWQLISGSLPSGLSLNSTSGQITGTPTAAVTNLPLTFKVTDSTTPTAQTATANLSLTIATQGGGGGPLTITTTSLPAGQVNVAYSAALAAMGGTGPYTWTTRRLPAGLTLNPNGQITGTVTNPVDQLFQFTVTDSSSPTAQSAIVTLELTFN